jgi:hypothetical protein
MKIGHTVNSKRKDNFSIPLYLVVNCLIDDRYFCTEPPTGLLAVPCLLYSLQLFSLPFDQTPPGFNLSINTLLCVLHSGQ